MLMKRTISPDDEKEAYAERLFFLVVNKLPEFVEGCFEGESNALKASVRQVINESNHIVEVEQAISKLVDRIVQIQGEKTKSELEYSDDWIDVALKNTRESRIYASAMTCKQFALDAQADHQSEQQLKHMVGITGE